jgi:uncharacterized protein (DUF2267 family)
MHNAEHAVGATLKAMGEALFEVDAIALARELPSSVARLVLHCPRGSELTQADFYRHVSRYEGVPTPVAVEHAQAVCRALGSLLPACIVARLRTALPHLAWLFVAPDRDAPTMRPEDVSARARRDAAKTHGQA